MDEELKDYIHNFIEEARTREQELRDKYPADVPNPQAHHAIIKGYSFENSFCPKVGEYNYFFKTPYETLYLWTFKKDQVTLLVSDVNTNVKDLECWKTIGNIIDLSLMFCRLFESTSFGGNEIDYRWMYYFDSENADYDSLVFYKIDDFERENITNGRIIKATDISQIANIIELLIRDENAYTAISLLYASLRVNHCCLICELSKHPIYHDHISREPNLWNKTEEIPNLEMAIVSACRSVESVLGEPPNSKNMSKVFKFKQKFKDSTGINPDDQFNKAGISFFDFYYKLFHNLRNPSAHSYGNVHYDLKKQETVTAQCFAKLIIDGYLSTKIIDNDSAIKKLEFNVDLLNKVQKGVSFYSC